MEGPVYMKRYIAFLRGINISGKNKISMADLKKGFEGLGLKEVKTYLNSGNVIFSGNENILCGQETCASLPKEGTTKSFANQIEIMIKNQFNLDIPVFVISKEELEDILHHAPDWWGDENKEIYDNLIFVIPPVTAAEVFSEIGEPKTELEQVKDYREAIFWSFSRKDYQKTNWWSKTASTNISSQLTIRTANTVRKIVSI